MKILSKTMLSLLALGAWTAAQAGEVEMTIDVAGVERKVVISLDEEIAPKTSANFIKLCGEGFYDGISFHRVISNYIVQGGDPLTKDSESHAKWGTGGPGYTIPAEMGGKHVRGAVAAARLGDQQNPERESSGSQFYVTLRDVKPLDGQYTVFGKVTEGLEVFDEIAGAPTDQNKIPTEPIKIVGTKVLSSAPAQPTSLTSAPASPSSPPTTPAAAPAPTPAPAPAPAPVPQSPSSVMAQNTATTPDSTPKPEPLSSTPASPPPAEGGESGIRFTPQGEETMEVNVDRGTPSMPRLQTNADKMVEATKKLTGSADGFLPMSEVGGGNTVAASPPSPAPVAEPGFASQPEPDPIPLPDPPAAYPAEPDPIPLSSQIEPDPLSPAAGAGATAEPSGGSITPIPPSGDVPEPPQSTRKPSKPSGPLGRFIRRIW